MTLLLDTGALVAYERGSKRVQAFLEAARKRGERVRTTTPVVAQAWRGGPRSAPVARLLHGVDEVAFSPERARAVGALLAAARTADVVDASVIEVAGDGDEVLTSDPADLAVLAAAAGKTLIVTLIS